MTYIKKNMYIHIYDYYKNAFTTYFIPKKRNEKYELDKGSIKSN